MNIDSRVREKNAFEIRCCQRVSVMLYKYHITMRRFTERSNQSLENPDHGQESETKRCKVSGCETTSDPNILKAGELDLLPDSRTSLNFES